MDKLKDFINKINFGILMNIRRILSWILIFYFFYAIFRMPILIEERNFTKVDMFLISNYEKIIIPSFAVFVVCLIIQIIKLINKDFYDKNGIFAGWYDKTIKAKGTKWVIEIGEEILKLNSDFQKEIKFVSPSANKATYEKILFRDWVNKKIHVQMIASDIAIVEESENSEVLGNAYFKYFESKDAFNLQDLLIENNIHKVDIIWDFKGVLWYSIKNKNDIKNIIDVFHNLLDENGYYIIDNIESKWYITLIRKIIYELIDIYIDEKSTYKRLNDRIKKDSEIEEYILHRFDIVHLEPDKHKKMKTVALKKK